MTAVKEDDNWQCTTERQRDLIKLHAADKKKWKSAVAKMIRDHPSKFSILTVGVTDDGDNLYTFNEFAAHFSGTLDNKQLLQLVYDDMDHSDATHIKFVAIHRWINEAKLQKKSEIKKDHKWLFTKILHVQAAHLDADGSGEVDRQEFVDYFVTKIGFPSNIAMAMFDDIDVNNDGDLTVMEYTKWKSKHNKPDKLKKFLQKIEQKKEIKEEKKVDNEEEDDKKCQQCQISQKQVAALNNKYKQTELKLKSVNSKHTNLLQDYKKLSTLLDAEKAKPKNSDTASSHNGNAKKIGSLQRENARLHSEAKIHSTEINNIKQNNQSSERQIKNLQTENEELKTQNNALMNQKGVNMDIKGKLAKVEMNLKLKEEEIATLKTQMQNNNIDNNAVNNNSSNRVKMYQQENEELNDKIDAQNKKIKQLKKQINGMEEENDEYKIAINTKSEEIKLLKERMDLNLHSEDDKSKQLQQDNESLEFQVEKQKKDIKRLKAEIEEEQENVDRAEKEKRKIKAEMNKKDGEITILRHKLVLREERKDLESGTENDQIKKLKANNQELDEENMKQQLHIKNLKEQINNLQEDVAKEQDHFHRIEVELDKEKSSTQNYQQLKDIQTAKMAQKEKEIEALMDERQTLKQEVISINALLQKHDMEKEKISAEKQALLNKVEKEKNNQVALMQQFDQMENKKARSVEGVQSELDSLKAKYSALGAQCEENESKHNVLLSGKEQEIAKLVDENKSLQKKVQTEKNHLDAVLLEVTQLEEEQKRNERDKVTKIAVKAKNDLSKLNVQIEILNSDVFRMKSLLLLSKYEQVGKKKYYGFLDFAAKDLSDKALANVYKKLKVKDKISATALAPLLGVIVKLYIMRLGKLKTGKAKSKGADVAVDRRAIEHLGVWIIRQHSSKTNKSETITIVNDANQQIKGSYAVYDGYVLKKEMATLFAHWCMEYVECQGRHENSQLK